MKISARKFFILLILMVLVQTQIFVKCDELSESMPSDETPSNDNNISEDSQTLVQVQTSEPEIVDIADPLDQPTTDKLSIESLEDDAKTVAEVTENRTPIAVETEISGSILPIKEDTAEEINDISDPTTKGTTTDSAITTTVTYNEKYIHAFQSECTANQTHLENQLHEDQITIASLQSELLHTTEQIEKLQADLQTKEKAMELLEIKVKLARNDLTVAKLANDQQKLVIDSEKVELQVALKELQREKIGLQHTLKDVQRKLSIVSSSSSNSNGHQRVCNCGASNNALLESSYFTQASNHDDDNGKASPSSSPSAAAFTVTDFSSYFNLEDLSNFSAKLSKRFLCYVGNAILWEYSKLSLVSSTLYRHLTTFWISYIQPSSSYIWLITRMEELYVAYFSPLSTYCHLTIYQGYHLDTLYQHTLQPLWTNLLDSYLSPFFSAIFSISIIDDPLLDQVYHHCYQLYQHSLNTISQSAPIIYVFGTEYASPATLWLMMVIIICCFLYFQNIIFGIFIFAFFLSIFPLLLVLVIFGQFVRIMVPSSRLKNSGRKNKGSRKTGKSGSKNSRLINESLSSSREGAEGDEEEDAGHKINGHAANAGTTSKRKANKLSV